MYYLNVVLIVHMLFEYWVLVIVKCWLERAALDSCIFENAFKKENYINFKLNFKTYPKSYNIL